MLLRHEHEQAFLLAKGDAGVRQLPPPTAICWTGSIPATAITPPRAGRGAAAAHRGVLSGGRAVLDPFCESGSTLMAARACDRAGLDLELDHDHWRTAEGRLRQSYPGSV